MRHLQKFENYGEVNFSDLDDNWSSYYHLSEELEKAKIEFRELGRNGFIQKIVDIMKNVDEATFKNLMKQSVQKFHVHLPEYKRAIDENYWYGRFGQISALVVIMGALTSGLDVEKKRIKEEINMLKQKLDSFDSI